MKHLYVIGLLLGTMTLSEAVKVNSQATVDQRLSQGLMETVKELEQLDELTTHSLEATLKADSSNQNKAKVTPKR